MNVLVAVASKHGSTSQLGEKIAAVLADEGLHVERFLPEEVPSVEPYDAVILGSAVYAGHWLETARSFAQRHADALRDRPVWLFSSGPLGETPMPAGDAAEIATISDLFPVRGHRNFTGSLDRDLLGFGERTLVRMVRAPYGDFRDWAEVAAWAREIARDLTPMPVGAVPV
jgi:menaquinone-dependent protoporphyrinogen oxidase